jgi:hypothetical protein
MELFELALKHLNRLNPRIIAFMEKHMRKIPAVQQKIETDTKALCRPF